MKKILFTLLLFLGTIGLGWAQSDHFSSLDNEAFAKVIKQKRVQVVDVRSPEEYAAGHLANAINIDVNRKDFDKQIETLKKKKPVAVYCRSGRRSKIAAGKLADKGYTVYELDHGIAKWEGDIIK